MAHQASLIFNNTLRVNSSKIPVGIHTNCTVESVVLGDKFFDINFKNDVGEVHNKRLWAPNGNYPKKLDDGTIETKEMAVTREEVNNLAHVIKLIHIFLGDEGISKFPALEYEAFLKKAVEVLTPKLSTQTVNLKLIYDADGMYSTFGNFPDYMERHIEGVEPNLKFSKWELENRFTKKEKPNNTLGESTSKEDLANALKQQ